MYNVRINGYIKKKKTPKLRSSYVFSNPNMIIILILISVRISKTWNYQPTRLPYICIILCMILPQSLVGSYIRPHTFLSPLYYV